MTLFSSFKTVAWRSSFSEWNNSLLSFLSYHLCLSICKHEGTYILRHIHRFRKIARAMSSEKCPLSNIKWVIRRDTGNKKRKINLFSDLLRKHFFLHWVKHFIFLQLKLSKMQFGSWSWALKLFFLSRIQIPIETGNVFSS